MTLACKFSRRHLDFVLVRSVLHGNIAKHGSDHRNHMFSQTCTCKVTLGDLSRCKKKGGEGGKAYTTYLYHSTKQSKPTRNFGSDKTECKKGVHVGDPSFDQ